MKDVMKKLSNEDHQMILNDIGNARQRKFQVEPTATASKLSKNITSCLAIGTTLITEVRLSGNHKDDMHL